MVIYENSAQAGTKGGPLVYNNGTVGAKVTIWPIPQDGAYQIDVEIDQDSYILE